MPNNRITLCENALDPSTWETHECEDIRRFLVDHFGAWPKTAKIYLNRVSKETDVTPYDEGGVERLGYLNGHFFVVVYPEGFAVIALIVAIALAAVSMVMSFLLRPELPENQQQQSPTNSLTNRENRERLGGRIPDIYGTLWVTPDLIGVPYRIFIGNREVEYMYLCIGRGEYDIAQVRDDVTPIEQITGAGCEIYGPNTSPNSGDAPQLSYGEPINEPIRNVKRYSSINGQSLRAPNASTFKASENVRFTDAGVVEGAGDVDFTDYFDAGTDANPKYLKISNSDYDGTYLILAVTTTQIVLSNPGSVNTAWNSLSGETDWTSPTLINSGDNYEGPYYVIDNTAEELWCNFVAPQGLYKIDSDGNQHPMVVTVQIEVTSIDNNYNTQGSPIYFQITLKGSEVLRNQCGATLAVNLPIAGSCQVRARRLTNTELRDGWSVVDQVQWRDLYGVSPLEETDFGNVTTIQTVTWPTPQALSLKQRKINVLIGRQTTTTSTLLACYPLDELSGTNVRDTKGEVDGTIHGNITQGVPGVFNTAYEFTGDGYVTIPYATQGTFDIDFYYKSTETSTYSSGWNMSSGFGLLSTEKNGFNYDWSLNQIGGKIVFTIGDTTWGDTSIVSENDYNDGEFHHIRITRNGTTGFCQLYIDEILIGSVTPPTDPTHDLTTATLLTVGAIHELESYTAFKGVLDNITINDAESHTVLNALNNAADILCEMALDPYIGRRVEAEIDRGTIQAVLGPAGEVETYFGTPLCAEFSYAFDDSKMSFEEMAAILGKATFCTVYRRGNILSVFLEKETDDSTILFNHRNKIPGTETRSVKFGTASENDGIDLDYIEPNAPNAQNIDSVVTLRFPTEGSPTDVAVAPKKIKAIGVRNRVQAWMIGWRLYNKLLYQNTATEFEATAEAALCVINERLLIADNTRPDIQDGEVIDQNALELTLSQDVDLSAAGSYSIFLQLPDGTVESIAITEPSPGDGSHNKVVLAGAPSQALVYDETKYARTTYMIVNDSQPQASAFLLQEKDPKGGGRWGIKAVNYDERYYDHDQDYAASPRIIDVIAPGDGTGAGYSAQASSSVFVSGKTMPWLEADNPSYPFGIQDGKPPVAIPLQAVEGEEITIACNAPGQNTAETYWQWLFWSYVGSSNTVSAKAGEHEWVDADGEDDQITGQNLDSGDGWSNKRFPTYYATTPALGHCCLMGAFAKEIGSPVTGYEVIEALAIGFGGNYTVPAGGVTHLLLGINDTKFSDNGGGFQVLVTQTGAAAGAAAAEDPEPDDTTDDPNTTTYIVTANGE